MRPRNIITLLALLAASFIAPSAAWAAANPYQRGPDPSVSTLTATSGPYATAKVTVAGGNGFGGGTIYYPTSTADGTFGGIAIAPGLLEAQSGVAWYGPRIASQGFVVFTIDTNSLIDDPKSRATQLQAALDYLVDRSAVRNRVDRTRLAVMGHSFGGGGALDAARANPSLKAVIPLAGFEADGNFSALRVPAMILAMQIDFVAINTLHSQPFYNSIPSSVDKAYVEVAGATHYSTSDPNPVIQAYSVAWLKRFVDSDTRYDKFLCPVPSQNPSGVSALKGTCPL